MKAILHRTKPALPVSRTRAPNLSSAEQTSSIVWLSKSEAAVLIPGMTPGKLDRLRLDDTGGYTPFGTPGGPPYRVLSDRTLLYDELLLRRWAERTVSGEWLYGLYRRPQPSADRAYCYQDATLEELRQRTYITPRQLLALMPDMPRWRADQLRAMGLGPRFLKPTARTVVYIAEEALYWAEYVPDYSFSRDLGDEPGTIKARHPYTVPVGFERPLTIRERRKINPPD